jgi:hypothetical protein
VSSAARPWTEHRRAVGVPADRPSMSPRRVPTVARRANARTANRPTRPQARHKRSET